MRKKNKVHVVIKSYLLDWTTAWVCSEVPDAMLVRAQAASNCWKHKIHTKMTFQLIHSVTVPPTKLKR